MRYGIVKGDKVLIDTSIWIEYFRNQNKLVCETVDCKIFSLDEHFKTIKKFMNLELIA